MPRATICVSTENPEEVAAVDSWFVRWENQLSYLSENCGCCVDLYDVEGPEGAIADLPAEAVCDSEWVRTATRNP